MALDWGSGESQAKKLKTDLKPLSRRKTVTMLPMVNKTATTQENALNGKLARENAFSGKTMLPSVPAKRTSTGATLGNGNKTDTFAKRFALGSENLAAGMLGAAEGASDFVGTGVYKGIQGVTSAGGLLPNKVSEWAGEQAQKYLDNSVTEKYKQSIQERYNPTEWQNQIGNVEQTVSAMLPSVGAAIFTGNPLVGKAMMGAQAAGQAASQASKEGASANRALAYGAAQGVLETAIEGISGGIPGLGKGVVGEAMHKIMKSPVAEKIIDIAGEGGEEALSTFLTPYFQRAIYNKDAKNATADELAQSAIMGIAAAGIMQAGIALPNYIGDKAAAKVQMLPSVDTPAETVQNGAGAVQGEAHATSPADAKTQTSETVEPAASISGASTAANIAESLNVGDKVTLPSGVEGTVTARDGGTITFEFENGGKAYAKLDGSAGSGILDRINSGEIQVEKVQPTTLPIRDAATIENPANDALQEQQGANTSQNDGTGVGAMDNPYQYQQGQSKVGENTFSKMYKDVVGQLESDGANLTDLPYDVATEKQSMERAQQRLTTDIGGEMKDLPEKESWSGEDLDTAMGILDKLTYEASETHDYTEVNNWAKLIQGKGTAAGQMIQAFAKYSRTPQGAMVNAAKTLDGLNMGAAKKAEILDTVASNAERISSIKDGDTSSMQEVIRDIAKARNTVSFRTKDIGKTTNSILQQLDYETLKTIATAQLDSIASDYVKPSLGKKISTYQVLSHLSSVGTFLRNSIGNTTFDIKDTIANDFSVPADAILGQFTGKRTVGLEKSWLSAQKRAGAINAAKQALAEVMLDVDTSGAETRYGTTSRRTNKMVGGPLSRFFSRWEGLLSLSLNVTDEFAKGGTRAETLESLDKFVQNGQLTQEEASAIADHEALYRTFQDKTKLGGVLSAAKDALNQWGIGDSGRRLRGGQVIKEFGVGDLVDKYPGVPGALVTRAVEYSPAGLVKGGIEFVDALKAAKSGTMDAAQQRSAATSIGRALVGTGKIVFFYAVAKIGLMKRADDENDADVAALNSSEGLTGTQWNIDATKRWLSGEGAEWRKGDTLVSIGFLQPENGAMTIGALLADSDEIDFPTAASSTVTGILESASDLSMIQNISTVSKDLMYGAWDEIPGQLLQNTASGFVPAPIRQAAKASDNIYRDAYSSVGDSLKNSIPGLRQTLPERLTPFGETKTYTDNPALNAMNALLLPGAINTYKPTALSGELKTLRQATDDTSIYPSRKAPNSFSVGDGVSVSLTSDQKREFQQTYGQTAYKVAGGIISDDQYKTLTDAEKAQAVGDAYIYAMSIAKMQASKDYEPAAWVKKAMQMTPAARSEYMLYRAIWSSQGDGSSKADQVQAVTSGHDFSDTVLLSGLTENQVKNYNTYAKGKVDAESYLLASAFHGSATTDRDANGKAIKGHGATDKTLAYIDKMKLTNAQKRALAESIGIAESTAAHKWPKYKD